MPVDSQPEWRSSTSPKQDELREACKRYRFVLASGCRYSGKTMGAYHCICDHAWGVSPANICAITISQTVGFDSGIWKDLTRTIIPEWIAGDFGFNWVMEPYTQNISKKPTCEVTNYKILDIGDVVGVSQADRVKILRSQGATTEIQLESLKNEDEVEDRFKPRRYSMIYVPELSTFRMRKTFNTWTECLRMIGLPEDKHIFLGDSNPPDDASWWLHDLWWSLMSEDENLLDATAYGFQTNDNDSREALLELKHNLFRLDFSVEDNPFADPKHVLLLKAKYADNEEAYRRYILGECVRTTEGSLFYKVFRPNFHIVGEIETPANKEPEIIVPSPNTFELVTGLDPGVTNCAFVIQEKIIPDEEFVLKFPQYTLGEPIFNILDELVVVGEDFDLEDFVEAMVRKMDYWEGIMEKQRRVKWTHWSDRSAFDMKLPFSGETHWHKAIFQASGGRIQLQAADRGHGSVNQRTGLFRKLLYGDRIFINAHCFKTIDMIKSIRSGTTAAGGIARGDTHKHVFDANSYSISSECRDEMARSAITTLRNIKRSSESGSLVQVAL